MEGLRVCFFGFFRFDFSDTLDPSFSTSFDFKWDGPVEIFILVSGETFAVADTALEFPPALDEALQDTATNKNRDRVLRKACGCIANQERRTDVNFRDAAVSNNHCLS